MAKSFSLQNGLKAFISFAENLFNLLFSKSVEKRERKKKGNEEKNNNNRTAKPNI